MAIGDRTPAEIIAPVALSATATARYTNSAANRTQVTGIWLSNNGASERKVSLYKNGTATVNMIASAIVLPASGSIFIDLAGKALVFTGTQTLAAKQDAGADVTMAAYGIIEQIA
ncbi:hypothetical protein D3P09_11745 [Paenibacillus pinisoli]|uniref:Uncharacterized protein n=1 Tax=Paenibacillus pinisoli TaxID=1276110 RepID=A0A3A6PTM4_9BACL|nr:hypothetical protein [Paenibacillus pinisoli]RJX40041.1 hypothetical protein D3P09_11745 [Paenibacillus pinisoli]